MITDKQLTEISISCTLLMLELDRFSYPLDYLRKNDNIVTSPLAGRNVRFETAMVMSTSPSTFPTKHTVVTMTGDGYRVASYCSIIETHVNQFQVEMRVCVTRIFAETVALSIRVINTLNEQLLPTNCPDNYNLVPIIGNLRQPVTTFVSWDHDGPVVEQH